MSTDDALAGLPPLDAAADREFWALWKRSEVDGEVWFLSRSRHDPVALPETREPWEARPFASENECNGWLAGLPGFVRGRVKRRGYMVAKLHLSMQIQFLFKEVLP